MSLDKKRNWKLKKTIAKHFPIINWIRSYSKEDAISDLVAGITISLTMIPQSIAYASLADLTPRDGLHSAFMGCFIYVFFGTIKEVVIGPTSLMALLTYEYTHKLNLDFVVLLCFLCGIVELIMGILRLGFMVDFISQPVVSGFTSATAIIILLSQIKGIIGVRFKSKNFIENLQKLYNNREKYNIPDVYLGISCIVALLLLRSLKDIKVSRKVYGNKIIMKIFWFLSIGRNALAVVVTSWIAHSYITSGTEPPFLTTREVEPGLPNFTFPPTTTQIGNHTYDFLGMVQELGTGIIVIPIVSVLANVAIAKAYADGPVEGSQEMLTLALCNIAGAFVQSMPTCGAFTRSAVISASGVKTPLACLYSAGLTLMALNYLASHFHLIPRATLSAILICAVIFLFDYQILKPLWKSSKRDFMTLIITLIACLLFGVEVGLGLGVVAGLLHLVYLWSSPNIEHKYQQTVSGRYIIFTPRLGLFFPSIDYVNNKILNTVKEYDGVTVVLDCTNLTGVDYTSVKSLFTLSQTLEKKGLNLIFINVPNTLIYIWKNSNCNKLNLLSSSELDKIISGEVEEKFKSTTLSIIQDSDRRASLHENEELLKNDLSKSHSRN